MALKFLILAFVLVVNSSSNSNVEISQLDDLVAYLKEANLKPNSSSFARVKLFILCQSRLSQLQ